jgi:hypothetical protein
MNKFSLRFHIGMNVVSFVAVVIMNYLAVSLPLNGKTTGELSDNLPNYFVPAGFTFSIWGIIYLLLFGFFVYQLWYYFKSDKNALRMIPVIGHWFIISCLANVSWIVAWHYEEVFYALGIMLVLLYSLMKIYVLIRHISEITAPEKYFIFIPFSVYLGWISVATIANFTAFFVDTSWTGFGMEEVYWAVILIFVALLLSLIVLRRERDYFFNFVIIWAFFGIYSRHKSILTDDSNLVTNVALIALSTLIIATIVFLIQKSIFKNRHPVD